MAPTAAPRILLATNIERGQCGVFLATAAALLRSNPNVDLHFASFSPLEKEVRAISDEAVHANSATRPITFHTIAGKSHADACKARICDKYGEDCPFPTPAFTRPLSTSTTMATIRDLCSFLIGWDGPGFMEVYDSFNETITAVAPDLIIVDLLMSPAISAAWNSGIRISYLSPNSIKDFVGFYQPYLGFLWKYPALMSGYDYPVPWHQKPLNVFHCFHMVYQMLKEPSLAATKRYVEEKTGNPMRSMMNMGKIMTDYAKIFVSTLPELDFPLQSHARIVPCGPIINDAQSVSASDPKLAAWLAKGPTIYVNLGSLFALSENRAAELATGLNLVLDELDSRRPDRPRMQVLWKLKKHGEYATSGPDAKVHAAFSGKVDSGRVCIVDWLECPPISILRSSNVACAVHHGGASSYNEAILAGVPHVVLPFWTDCYEYANRVEMLGIGRKGCRKQQPIFEAVELSKNILDVVESEAGKKMKTKALELAELCKKNGDGAEIAAQGILKLASESTAVAPKEA